MSTEVKVSANSGGPFFGSTNTRGTLLMRSSIMLEEALRRYFGHYMLAQIPRFSYNMKILQF